jgi:hypothetical protein
MAKLSPHGVRNIGTMKRVATLAVAALFAIAAPAGSQPQIDDPEATVVEELVVVARDRGPAWWRVSDEDTTVYILALPDTALPPGLKWDTAGLERRLRGSNYLIGDGVAYKPSLRDIPLLLSLRRAVRTKGEMEDDLPEPLRARFVAARERLGKPSTAYKGWGPLVAGQLLVRDSRTGPKWRDADDEVRRLARRLKVRERKAPTHKAAPLIRQFKAGLTPDIQNRCLEAALDDLEAGNAKAVEAARGWADGDVRRALGAPRGFEKCFLILAGGPEVWRQSVDDKAGQIAEALKQPGKAVAMIRLRRLIAKDGVIEKLEAMGLEVDGPQER